jgi:hypothetical protein
VLTQEQIDDIAETLRGTATSLEEQLERYDTDFATVTVEDCRALDELVFCCDACGWWCGRDEESDEPGVCDDCA